MSRIIRRRAWNPWGLVVLAMWGWEEQPFPSKARHRLFGKEMLREGRCACSSGTILATMKLGIGEGWLKLFAKACG